MKKVIAFIVLAIFTALGVNEGYAAEKATKENHIIISTDLAPETPVTHEKEAGFVMVQYLKASQPLAQVINAMKKTEVGYVSVGNDQLGVSLSYRWRAEDGKSTLLLQYFTGGWPTEERFQFDKKLNWNYIQTYFVNYVTSHASAKGIYSPAPEAPNCQPYKV